MRKCFISYKKEDVTYKNYLVNKLGSESFINKSLDRRIDSNNGDYVMQVIRKDYLCDSTVTIFLIGQHSSEDEGYDFWGDKNYFIKRELAASLYNGVGNTRNGILGVVLPNMYDSIFGGNYNCNQCGGTHSYITIQDSTVIREFSCNYYTEPHYGCSWSEDERYCVLVKWDDFIESPDIYIEKSFQKRFSSIAEKIRIRNIR